jgi:hypothetical protein
LFDSYKQFTRMGGKRRAKPGEMKQYSNYLEGYVLVTYEHIIRETTKATLFVINQREVWLPKSKTTTYIINNSIEIPRWMAEANNLTYEKIVKNST